MQPLFFWINILTLFIIFPLSHAMKGEEEDKESYQRTQCREAWYYAKAMVEPTYRYAIPDAPVRYIVPIYSISATELLVVIGRHGQKYPDQLESRILCPTRYDKKEHLLSLAACIINPQTKERIGELETYKIYDPTTKTITSPPFKNATLEKYKHLLQEKYAGDSLYKFMKENAKTITIPDLPYPLEKVCAISYTPEKDMFAALLYDGGKISLNCSGVSHECVIFRKIGSSFKKYACFIADKGFVDLAWNKTGTLLATEETYSVSIWSPELPHPLIHLSKLAYCGESRGITWDATKNTLYRGYLCRSPDRTKLEILQCDLRKDVETTLEKECNRLTDKMIGLSRRP